MDFTKKRSIVKSSFTVTVNNKPDQPDFLYNWHIMLTIYTATFAADINT